ncbi:endogenous retrovirus group K member 7 Pro protein-like [Mustela lutreola]|uniref:endogenous retrovirus group K member 7 Pro protein-like n=1 Tax=Mustela lutreola TaxID=9666 RepID=UPI002797A699|nr:endogenous retrovirus group K member 7 Pro protein-like [Mustela lutreola]
MGNELARYRNHEKYPSTGQTRKGGFGSTGSSLACLTMSMKERPMLKLKIRGKLFWELLDTGADKSIINCLDWPKAWALVKASQTLRGLGIATSPDISAASLDWEDEEGHKGIFQPYVCSTPVSLWGRNVLEQMNIKLTTEKLYSEASQTMMRNMGYKPGQGLGTKGQGDPNPPSMGGQVFS